MNEATSLILQYADAGADLRRRFFQDNAEKIRIAAFKAAISIARGGKILLCGNGGSAADSQHVACEFVNRFLMDRPALPAIALTTDTSILTAAGNDYSFERIFSRQIEALGRPGDVLLAISTSGKSANVIQAIATAKKKALFTIGLSGGNMMDCDIDIAVESESVPLIQEVHLAVEHLFCSLCDYYLFENVGEITPYLNLTETAG